MAIVKHVAGKNSSYQSAVDYLTFKSDEHNKLLEDENGFYIPRENCEVMAMNTDLDRFSIQCAETNKKYGQNQNRNDVKTHHYIISYEPGDNMSVERAREEALKMYDKFFKGHEGVIAIHNDGHNQSGNAHIHIVINSTRAHEMDKEQSWIEKPSDWKEGSKHHCTKKFMYDFKEHVMDRSKELGLNQVDLLTPAKHKVTDREYRAGQTKEKDQLTKNRLREILTSSAKTSKDKAEFMDKLKDKGVEVTQRGNTITYQFENKKFRERALGTDYRLDELEKSLGKERLEPQEKVEVKPQNTLERENLNRAEVIYQNLKREIEGKNKLIEAKQRELDKTKGMFKYNERAQLKAEIDRLKEERSRLETDLQSKENNLTIMRQNLERAESRTPDQFREERQSQVEKFNRQLDVPEETFKSYDIKARPKKNNDMLKTKDKTESIVKEFSGNKEHDIGNPAEKSKKAKAKDQEKEEPIKTR